MKQLAVFVNKGFPETDTITFLGEIHAIHSHCPILVVLVADNLAPTLEEALSLWCTEYGVGYVALKPHFMDAPHATYDVKDYFTRAKQMLDNANDCRIFVGKERLERSNSWAYKYAKDNEVNVSIITGEHR